MKDKSAICDECAKEKKWEFPTWAVTVTKGDCPYCGMPDVILTPIVDFKKPGEKFQIWD